jgi:two-component system nitrogen regulation sensor histidine kinase NtrY
VSPRRRRPLSHEQTVFWIALAGGAPAVVAALGFLWSGDHAPKVIWTVTVLVLGGWLGAAAAVRTRVVRPLQTLSNLLAAQREGDYSLRARSTRSGDALDLALEEANALSAALREQRLGALEATALLRRVMSEIDVAIFAFDGERQLRLVNRYGERLLAQPSERLLGRSADALGLAECLSDEAPRVIDAGFPGAAGGTRWEVRRSTFRQGGLSHQLLVLADLSRTLREEERQVWQRLVRVLSHEINNSMAPIKSIAGSLRELLDRRPPPADLDGDLRRGLEVVGGRADSLGRFMASYARMARLPRPAPQPIVVDAWIRRVADLEKRLAVTVCGGPAVTIRADGDQLDQLLINLVGNAVDAALDAGAHDGGPDEGAGRAAGSGAGGGSVGGVRIAWSVAARMLEVRVEDDGPGLPASANLFVPFFTTKPAGSGIGLVLSRQIAEAHGGTLTVANRAGARGCVATLRLPLGA